MCCTFFFLKEKSTKNLAGLSLVDFEGLLSRSPIGYHPPQRTRL
jgi:hypothetical protein